MRVYLLPLLCIPEQEAKPVPVLAAEVEEVVLSSPGPSSGYKQFRWWASDGKGLSRIDKLVLTGALVSCLWFLRSFLLTNCVVAWVLQLPGCDCFCLGTGTRHIGTRIL